LEKLELIIDDDSDVNPLFKNIKEEAEFRIMIEPVKLFYLKNKQKRTIGQKRNNLVKKANNKIIAMMDSDDLYLSDYLKHSIEIMKKEKAGLVCSNQMLFLYPRDNWLCTGIQCRDKRMGHEATMVFTKKHWKAMGGFTNNSQGEGTKMVDGMTDSKVAMSEIIKCMICICHSENTINKDRFKESDAVPVTLPEHEKRLIKYVFGIN
jgi:glycosyltransferase involved in cell wall biosynthesis